ncbi:hypothetical protein ACIOD2_27210 [Amycolatopsis sp. NPDC088138]|uniref:hypothetical protein n=1 Tax=Amycolatopsis sp. NPDC088138 TaxID=3363938 RepID=UPI003800D31F
MAVEVRTSRNYEDTYPNGEYFEAARAEGILYVYGGKDSRGDDKVIAIYSSGNWQSAKITESSAG